MAAGAILLVFAACGAGDDRPSSLIVSDVATPPPPATSGLPFATATTTPETTLETEAPTTSTTSTGSAPTASTPIATTTPTAELPGDRSELRPSQGATLSVVGVRYDDVLNMRADPGTEARVVQRLGPLTTDAVATGRARRLVDGTWFEIVNEGVTGWASASYLGHMSVTDDATELVIARAGRTPQTATMYGLGRTVAAFLGDGNALPRIRVVAPGSLGAAGEVTVDILDIGDEAVMGYRLLVKGRRLVDGEGYRLTSLERTTICLRGLTSSGTCI